VRTSWTCALLDGGFAIEPFLSGLKTFQSRNAVGEVDALPFRIEARGLKLVDPAEQFVDELRNPTVARRVEPPVDEARMVGTEMVGIFSPLAIRLG